MFLSSTPDRRWNQIWVLFLAVEFIYCARWVFISPQWIPLVIGWATLFVVEHFWWNRHTFRTLLQVSSNTTGHRDKRMWIHTVVNTMIDVPVALVILLVQFAVIVIPLSELVLSRYFTYFWWFHLFPLSSIEWLDLVAMMVNMLLFVLSNWSIAELQGLGNSKSALNAHE